MGDDNHVHSLQKGLKGAFTAAEFTELMEEARKKGEELRNMVHALEGGN